MAPSTPPPPSRLPFAALTMASVASVVMSATQISSRVVPISAERMGAVMSYLSRRWRAEDRPGGHGIPTSWPDSYGESVVKRQDGRRFDRCLLIPSQGGSPLLRPVVACKLV